MNRLEHGRRAGVNVPRSSDPHPALEHRTEIGDDIPKQVGRDDHVEPLRVLDHPHAACVHVRVIGFYIGKVFGYLRKRAGPNVMRPNGVGLVDKCQLGTSAVASLRRPPLSQLERVP